MIEFSNDKRFLGAWFVYPSVELIRGRRADWMCISWLNPDGKLGFTYRFHYYDDEESPADGERSWYEFIGDSPADDASIIKHKEAIGLMAHMTMMRNESKIDFVDLGRNPGDKVIEILLERPWFHVAKDDKELA